MTTGHFENFPGTVAQDMIDVNSYHYAAMHKVFLEGLIKRSGRDKRSAMIGVSSSSWLRHFPKFTVYTGTKAFASYLSSALIYESRLSGSQLEHIDIHCFVPSGTATNIVENKYFATFATTTYAAVTVALRDLG